MTRAELGIAVKHRFDKVLLGVAIAVCLGGLAWPVHAQSEDAEATQLADEALLSDYLAMNFDGAVSKLTKAIRLCGGDKCSGKTLARVHRDLGVVYIAGLGKAADGKAEFVAALTADPSVQLDADLATDEVKAVFAEVQASIGGGGGDVGGGDAAVDAIDVPGIDSGVPVEVPESGDLLHVPPKEQLVLTGVPLYVEVSGGTELTKIQVRYQSPTARDWKTVQMREVSTGYGVEIDCQDVGSTPGDFRYYIQGFDGNEPVAFSGTAKVPHRVKIVNQLSGEMPTLPGEPPPTRCETEECVPGMVIPGCPLPEGELCQVDEDCEGKLVCRDEICSKDVPVKPTVHWLSVAFQQDFVLFPAEQGICSGGNDYTCFFAGNIEYLGIPDANNGNEITGGFGLATQRVVLGYDYRLPFGLALGLQGGFAFGGGPESQASKFSPLHVEARATYYLSAGALEPYAVLAGGMAQVDSKITVSIRQTAPGTPEIFTGAGTDVLDIPTNVDAWRRAGRGFVALGLGARYLLGAKKKMGPFIELRGGKTFPNSTTILGARAGLSLGF